MKFLGRSLFILPLATACAGSTIAPPPPGKLYHGFYWDGIGTDKHDPTEHDVTPEDVGRYEQTLGKKTGFRLDYSFTVPFYVEDTAGSHRLQLTIYF